MSLPNATPTSSSRLAEWVKNPSAQTWAIVGLAFLLRALWLGVKPPHFDEGVNGWFVDEMTRTGYYHYDPSNYHGPFHFYVLFFFKTLFGREVEIFRLPLIVINTASVWLIIQFQRYLPRPACLLAALALAVSPGMMFYSRYAIHEAWLVFGMLLALWGSAELWFKGKERGLWCLITGVTLMILTKETYIIHIVSFGLALLTLLALERFIPSASKALSATQTWPRSSLFKALGVAVFLIVFFYSGAFLDFSSLIGLKNSFAEWIHTGTKGGGHDKPWHYWLELILRYEWPVLIGLLYSLRIFLPGMNRFSRLIGIYGLGVLAAYSIVRYKTPWCVISVIWPFLLLFGLAVVECATFCKEMHSTLTRKLAKAAIGIAAAGLVMGSLVISLRLNFFHYTDSNEPYVYVQSGQDFQKLTGNLKRLIKENPAAYGMQIHIFLTDYHPIPWLLHHFTATGYYSKLDLKPDDYDAGLLVVSEDRIAEVEAKLQQSYFVEEFKFRDDLSAGKLYLNTIWFSPLYPNREPDISPTKAPATVSEQKMPAAIKAQLAFPTE